MAGITSPTAEQLEKMDVTKDGLLLINDVMAIYRMAAGLS